MPALTPSEAPATRRIVLVTGAAGSIGRGYIEHASQQYDLRLMLRPTQTDEADTLRRFGTIVLAELADFDRMLAVCQGVDTIVHLAAEASPNATWDALLESNIVGTHNVFAAAKAAGCRRIIYASSIHAVGGYGPGVQVKTNEPVNPGDLYGVTKCFGEAFGRYMAEHEGVSVISLRIGAYQPVEVLKNPGMISIVDSWISPRDLNQLLDRCIETPSITYAVFHGLSDNAFNRLDISDAKSRLGYAPQDDATRHIPDLAPVEIVPKLMHHNLRDSFAKSGLRREG